MRLALFFLSFASGVAAVVIGLLMPAHLRAIDPRVLAEHGAKGKPLVTVAAETAQRNPAVAKIYLVTAEKLRLEGTGAVVENLRAGAADRNRSRTILEQLEAQEAGRIQVAEIPVLDALRKESNRRRLLESLHSIEAQQVLRTRELTNMTLFAPVTSAAGMPLEVAALTTAFLMEQRAFAPALPLRDEVIGLAADGGAALEEFYLSVFALAKRFSSEQIIALIANVPTAATLHTLTRFMQEYPDSEALFFTSAALAESGGAVAAYLNQYPESAREDFAFALSAGMGGLNELLARRQPVYRSGFYNALENDPRLAFIFKPLLAVSARAPVFALLLKFALIAAGGFLLAFSLKFRKPPPGDGYHAFPPFSLIRRAVFSGVFVLLAIVLGEPYLAQGNQRAPQTTWNFPILAANTPAIPIRTETSTPMIDQHTLLAIATFLILQGLIYAVCLVKLAEIRKQSVPSAVKIKLLENEDNLFDGGLYCGLFGTAASLILLTMGVIKPSLVSAYSSTLFGILFVALLKIGHVRPYKRRLLLETADPVSA